MLRRSLAAIILSLVACAVAFGQADAAREELNAGARSYREGDFAAAEAHFRRALELDPDSPNARLFMARAIQQQFKPGVETAENVATGERAVAAYKEILRSDPANEDAFKAVAFLYMQLKEDDKFRQLLFEHANNVMVSNDKRAEALVVLSGSRWECSYEITEQKENKLAVATRDRIIVTYKMPADATEFYRARECVNEGLQLVEKAVALDEKSVSAWSYKANLLREASKLAEMEGDKERKEDYDKQYAAALATHKRLSDEAAGKRAAEDAAGTPGRGPIGIAEDPPPPPPRPAGSGDGESQSSRGVISGGVLNGKAIYKPAPVYPPIAKAARAEGTVTVQILVDEDGNVVRASAVSGHPLLQQAAVNAARLARFTPTRLEGKPVKVRGVVTYNFVLQ